MKYPVKMGLRPEEGIDGPMELDDRGRVFYPSLFLEGKEEFDLPDEGELTIRFKKTGSSKKERRGGTKYTVDLDVLELVKVAKGKKEPPKGEEELDKLKEEATEDKED